MKKLLLFFIPTLLFTSCVSFKHNHRLATAPKEHSIDVANNYVTDLDINFKKKIIATSKQHKFSGDAKDEAYYNAITENDVHVVVDPIYKVQFTNILYIYRRYKADIVGYAGYYKDFRTQEEENTLDRERESETQKLAIKTEDELFEMRVKNLVKLAKIDALASRTNSTYMLDTQGETCCGTDKDGKVAGGNFGEVHLLHTTDNKSSLIDEYGKLVGIQTASLNSGNNSLSGMKSSSGSSKFSHKASKTGFRKMLCKLPIVRLFCK